jgi:ferredoxin
LATVRKLVQLVFVVAATVAGVRLATGASLTGIERYCPFGGLETAWSLITAQRFSCATGELNVSLFLAVVLLALIARKSFCSWICPVGAVHEWLGRAVGWVRRLSGARRGGGRAGLLDVPARTDRRLRWLRVVVLVAVLAATGASGELLFRPCDPFYVLFSFHGHDVEPWSYGALAVILGGGAVVAMAWCRYLCPLGVALWPFSRVGLMRIRRDATKCTDCGLCDRACPHGLQASAAPAVVSGECTLCLECRAACPTPGSLNVSAPTGAVLPTWLLPVALVVLTTAGVAGGRAFALPSYSHEYGNAVSGESTTVTLVVQGVRCVDTAAKAAAQLEELPGVLALVAYASRNQLKVDYDPAQVSLDDIRVALEGPVHDPVTGEYHFHVFEVLEVNP